MISPVAAMTTVRYEATYQWAGLTQLNAASGVVPNEPPMMSIVTTGKTKTKITVSGSRVIRISSVRTRRPAAVVIGALLPHRGLRGPRRARDGRANQARPGPGPAPRPGPAGRAAHPPGSASARPGQRRRGRTTPAPHRH